MKTAVLTFVYPRAEPYVKEFFNSLKSQTEKNFILYLVNDGISQIDKYLKNLPFAVKLASLKGTIVQLRKKGILWALSDPIEEILLADIDDYFDENRVAVTKEILSREFVMMNELVPFGASFKIPKPLIGDRWPEGFPVYEEHIRDENCLGFSNTAFRTEGTDWDSLLNVIPENILAFDWTFFTRLLHKGRYAYFTKKTRTHYRQHPLNAAPLEMLKDEQILKGVKVKWLHYKAVKDLSLEYEKRFVSYEQLWKDLSQDEAFFHIYCESVKGHSQEKALWWQGIKTREELALC